MCGVSSRSICRSSDERTRLEWTVATRYGRRWPISARAMAARVADGLGAVHVGVDDVRPDLGQVRRQRADGDRVVGLVDDEDRDAGALELADGAARRERDDRHVVARRVDAASTSANRCSWAPPFVPVARTSTTRIAIAGRGPGARRPRGRDRTGLVALIVSRPSSDEQPLDRLVDRAPLVLVGLVAAQEVEPPHARGEGALDVGVDHEDAGRQVARIGVDAGVVVEVAVGRLEVDARRDAAGRRRSGTSAGAARRRPNSSNMPAERTTRLWSPPSVGGNRPSSPQRFWWRSMNASRSASGSGESSSRISPTASARRTLRRISWRSFLPSVAR